jgi:hypothetical protein
VTFEWEIGLAQLPALFFENAALPAASYKQMTIKSAFKYRARRQSHAAQPGSNDVGFGF